MTEKMNILYPLNWTRAAAEEILSFQVVSLFHWLFLISNTTFIFIRFS